MSILRIAAIDQLAECIGLSIAELKGRICAGPAEHPTRLKLPSLSIVPVRYTFFPDQSGDIVHEKGDMAVFNVGRHEALLQLRVGAETARQRYELEHRVAQIFEGGTRQVLINNKLQSDGIIRPGVLVLLVPECRDATVAFELEQTEWDDELVFDKEWYSITTVTAQIPSLVTRHGVHTIEELCLSFTEDLDTSFANLPASAIETVLVAEDGSISAAP